MTDEFRPERILEVLDRHGLRYVLIGGMAAFLHGAAHITEDVDITPEHNPENLRRLSAALRDLGARVRTPGVEGGLAFDHDATSLGAAGVWNLVTSFGDLDISFVPTGTQGYVDLVRDAVTISVLGVTTTLASLADIVRSKEAAGRPKDLLALPTLRRLLDEREPGR